MISRYSVACYLYVCVYLCVCKQEIPDCQVYGQTVTTHHHNELIQMGIYPSLKWTEATHKFPNVIYCAPPSRTPDYAGNVRWEIFRVWQHANEFVQDLIFLKCWSVSLVISRPLVAQLVLMLTFVLDNGFFCWLIGCIFTCILFIGWARLSHV